MPALKFGAIVERVHVAGATVHEQLDNAAHLGGVMHAAIEFGTRRFSGEPLAHEQIAEGESRQATPTLPHEFAP